MQDKIIEIRQPKWVTKEVLVAVYRLRGLSDAQRVKVVFTEWKGGPLYMSVGDILRYPLTTNGTVACRRVPLGDFERGELINQEKLL